MFMYSKGYDFTLLGKRRVKKRRLRPKTKEVIPCR